MNHLITIVLSFFLSTSVLFAQLCPLPAAYVELDIGNSRVGLLNNGELWWDGSQEGVYEVPKGDTALGIYPHQLMKGGGIWMSAYTSSNVLKTAGMKMTNHGNEFFPGPLSNNNGQTTTSICNTFNRFFEIRKSEINNHISLINLGLPIDSNAISANILNWPAKGNQLASGFTIIDDLAPFHDYNNNGIYDPVWGDYPATIGDQSFFWVMNDLAGPHEIFYGNAMQVEIQCLAHAFENSALENTVIYEYAIVNKSFGNLKDFHFSICSDPYIAGAYNNFSGCDSSNNLSFSYSLNSAQMFGIKYLNQTMNSFGIIFPDYFSSYTMPTNSQEMRNWQEGKQSNGTPFCLYAFPTGAIPMCPDNNFMFSGNPGNINGHAMCHHWNSNSKYNIVQSCGPINFPAWSTINIAWTSHVCMQDFSSICPDLNDQFFEEMEDISTAYDSLKNLQSQAITSIRFPNTKESRFKLYPNPAHDLIHSTAKNLSIQIGRIISIEGRVVKTFGDAEWQQSVDVSHLKNGIYYMLIQTNQGTAIEPFIKH